MMFGLSLREKLSKHLFQVHCQFWELLLYGIKQESQEIASLETQVQSPNPSSESSVKYSVCPSALAAWPTRFRAAIASDPIPGPFCICQSLIGLGQLALLNPQQAGGIKPPLAIH